jgi:hypothetical protein
MQEAVVTKFAKLWHEHRETFGGVQSEKGWFPNGGDSNNLLLAALEVLQHYYDNYGGIWTGCFRLEKSPECRGALAGQSVLSTSTANFAAKVNLLLFTFLCCCL